MNNYSLTKNYTALKNFTMRYVVVMAVALLAITGSAIAQQGAKKLPPQKNASSQARCYTMEAMEDMIRKDPSLPEKWKAEGERLQKLNAAKVANSNTPNSPANVNAITYVPVVIHVVGTAANQAFCSDANLQRQIDVLNRDFAGLNADSAKLPPAFKALFGHSEIQFRLARRTPGGVATNGIERLVSAATYTSGTVSNLKHTATGGLDQWDGNSYFNIWVANFTDGLLGIATFPWMTPANEQGVAIHFGSIDQPCGSPFAGSFDGGRTLVHEVGHYFYLFHIWGDDGGACTTSDFRLQAGFPLPASCTDDTPNQGGNTSGCLTGTVTDACSPTDPGIMYQNYMDYTDDGCYALFTLSQNCRMQACLDQYRPTLKTSNGCVPVAPVNNDARVSEILNPNSRGFACGTTTTFCTSSLTPQVLLSNDGDAALTSVVFTIKVNGTTIATQNWTGNIAPGSFKYVTLNAFTSPAGVNNILRIETSLPNAAPDARPTNDFGEATYTVLATVTAPLTADFEPAAAAFPPANFSVINPDGARTWAKRTGVTGPTGASTSCMWLDAANYGAQGQIDIFRTNNISLAGVDSLKMSWNLAKTYWPGFTTDSLQIVYSTDCGVTWINAGYNRGGATFITSPPQGSDFVPTSAGQWISESISLSTCNITAPSVMLGFQFRNGFGNNIFIDNVNITTVALVQRNAATLAITQPIGTVCGTNFTPQVRLGNSGSNNLTAVTFNMQIDGGPVTTFNWTGNLARCSSALATLSQLSTTVGNHILTIYTTNPNGGTDQFTGNDTLRKAFTVSPSVALPVSEGFEGTFPSTGWVIQNPDGLTTWAKSTAAARTGGASMWINNPAVSNGTNTVDRLYTPVLLNSNTYDSIYISWDYAYKPGPVYPGSTALPLDTLEVMITKDCGATFTTIWKKWGNDLQSLDDPNYAYVPSFTPTQIEEWKRATIFLTPFVGSSNFQVYIVAKSNKQNNIWIDNINITPKIVPAKVKNQGYAIYPNPFNSSFRIHHWVAPTDLQAAQIFNSIGELVWDKRFNGNASTEEIVDAAKLAKGVYILKLTYATKTITERIIKQ